MIKIIPINSNTLSLVIDNCISNPETLATDIVFNNVNNDTMQLLIPLTIHAEKCYVDIKERKGRERANMINKPNWSKIHVFFQFSTKNIDEDALFKLTYDSLAEYFNPNADIIFHSLKNHKDGKKMITFRRGKRSYVNVFLNNDYVVFNVNFHNWYA